MAQVYISVGSNIDREHHVLAGLLALRKCFGPLVISTAYQNKAVGFKGDDFLNLVVGLATQADVRTVAASLREIEVTHGRRWDAPKFSPRTLDLDLLLYDELVLEAEGLQLPRDEITRYAFVLCPLAEVAGKRRHPILGATFEELWEAFDKRHAQLLPITLPLSFSESP